MSFCPSTVTQLVSVSLHFVCLSVNRSFSLSEFLSACLSACLSVLLIISLPIFLYRWLSLCRSFCLLVYLSITLPVCLPVQYPFVCLPIDLSLLYICLSLYQPFHLSVSLCFSVSIYTSASLSFYLSVCPSV